MPSRMGHVRVRGPLNDNYMYTYDFDTGDILMYSAPSEDWAIERTTYRRADGDGHPATVRDMLHNVDGAKLYRDFLTAWEKIMVPVPEECSGMNHFIGRVAACHGIPSMCPACGRIALDVTSCPSCGAFFGIEDSGEGYAYLSGVALVNRDVDGAELLAKITKLMLLAADGKVGINEGSSGPAFWLPAIHFDDAVAHRFKRILNGRKFMECTGMTNGEWVEVSKLITDDKFDEYIAFIDEYGKALMGERDSSLLIGDRSELAKLRKEYVGNRSYRNTGDMCDFFFTRRTDYLEELSVPLYNAMSRSMMLIPTINYQGSVNWQFEQMREHITPHDVRYQLLGIINDMMDDTSIDDIMQHVRSEFNA